MAESVKSTLKTPPKREYSLISFKDLEEIVCITTDGGDAAVPISELYDVISVMSFRTPSSWRYSHHGYTCPSNNFSCTYTLLTVTLLQIPKKYW